MLPANQRIDVMVSSTRGQLDPYREACKEALLQLKLTPLMMDYEPHDANEDTIQYSRRLVEEAQIYILLLGSRYGYIPQNEALNPDRISMVEMEYRCAEQANKRMYIFKLADDAVDPNEANTEAEQKYKAFRDNLRYKEKIIKEITNVDQLKAEIQLQLNRFLAEYVLNNKLEPSPLPEPPRLFGKPEYTLTKDFIGRVDELNTIDTWLGSNDRFLIIEALGGQGKSALAWEWVTRRQKYPFEGVVWWSFYEVGATIETLITETLAYLLKQHPKIINLWPTKERAQRLLAELKNQNVLLVLDGFERTLNAYAGLGSAYLADDNISEAKNDRESINPDDARFLNNVLTQTNTRVIITTRLIPACLEQFNTLMPSISHIKLTGLKAEDAEKLFASYGVTKFNKIQLHLFLEKLGYHSLMIKLCAGMVASFRIAPRDFDQWYQFRGSNINFSDEAVTEANHGDHRHIIRDIYNSLETSEQLVLNQLAMLERPASFQEINTLFNPYLPPSPPLPKLPQFPQTRPLPFGSPRLGWLIAEHSKTDDKDRLQRLTAEIELETQAVERRNQEIGQNQEALKRKEINVRAQRNEILKRYQEAYEASPEYQEAVQSFEAILATLENHGLLDWNITSNSYDLHPLIRGYISERVQDEQKAQSQERIIAHLTNQSTPLDRFLSLESIHRDIEIYRTFFNMKHYQEAVYHFEARLSSNLHLLGDNRTLALLLKPLFDQFMELKYDVKSSRIPTDLALAFTRMGDFTSADTLLSKQLNPAKNNSQLDMATALTNYAYNLARRNELARAAYATELAHQISITSTDSNTLLWNALEQFEFALLLGDLERATHLQNELMQSKTSMHLGIWKVRFDIAVAQLAVAKKQADAHTFLEQAHRTISTYSSRRREEYLQGVWAEYEYDQRNWGAAAEHATKAIHLANTMGHSTARHQIILGLIDLQQKNQEAALRAAENAIGDTRMPIGDRAFVYTRATEIYMQTSQHALAQEFAELAYTYAWADGPPYAHNLELKRAQSLLEQLHLTVPTLPTRSPESFALIFEDEIREMFLSPDQPFKPKAIAKPQIEFEVQGYTWFQVGTVAYFGVYESTSQNFDKKLIRQISEKLSSLNEIPLPVVLTEMGNELEYPSAEDFEIPMERIDWDDLKWDRRERLALDKTFVIAFISTHDANNKPVYAYINVRGDRLEGLQKQLKSGDVFNLSDYVTLVYTGENQPSLVERQKLFRDYLFGEYYINARIFPPLDQVTNSDSRADMKQPIRGCETFHIGVISTFGISDENRLPERISEKITQLNSQVLPLVSTKMGEDVPVQNAPNYSQNPLPFDQIRWEREDFALFDKVFLIAYILTKSPQNATISAYVNVRLDRVENLLKQLQSNEVFDLEQYATITKVEEGRPSAELLEVVSRDYLFYPSQVNLRRFPPLEEVTQKNQTVEEPAPVEPEMKIPIKSFKFLHIGTIAMFDSMDDAKLPVITSISEKLRQLNAVKLPIVISKIGEPIQQTTQQAITAAPHHWDQLAWTAYERSNLDKVFLVIALDTFNPAGDPRFAYVYIRLDFVEGFIKALDSNQVFDLEQFSNVLGFGEGTPDEELVNTLVHNYLFSTTQLNVIRFPPIDEMQQ